MPDHIDPPAILRLGTRGSRLARWQTDHVAALLLAAWPELAVTVDVLQTRGDKILDTPLPLIGGKGLFTAELEAALYSNAVDLAVHSLKDLPTEMPPGLIVGAIPERANARDVLISRSGDTLDKLPKGAVVGTSSRRRFAQLRRYYPDLHTADIRGNIDTRIRKVLDPAGPYDAIILAGAGITRLGYSDTITQILPLNMMLPAPGQGALAIQCRDEEGLLVLLTPLDDQATHRAVTAERAFLRELGGGCAVPIAAFARCENDQLRVQGRVTALDGEMQIDVSLEGDPADAIHLGRELARMALAQGAARILQEAV